MRAREFRIFLFLLVFVATNTVPVVFAQDGAPETSAAVPPSGPLPGTLPMEMPSGLPNMNPAQLLRMRNGLTFELQESQRILGLVGPGEKPLIDMHKQRQKEIVDQLKDIETQLKAQGIPVEQHPATPPGLPAIPKAEDPTLVPGGIPQPAADPNLLIQQRRSGMMDPMSPVQPGGMPQMPPGFRMMNPAMPPQTIQGFDPMNPAAVPSVPGATPSTGFDQDQAWANSPWTPQPSKELAEMKQTVESLRKEIGELRSSVKALETQIQLLNRNILLSQPQQPSSVPAN